MAFCRLVCIPWGRRSLMRIPVVSLALHSPEHSMPFWSHKWCVESSWLAPLPFKARFTLKTWTLCYPFSPPYICLKRGGVGKGRNKSLLLELLHDSRDQGTLKGHCPHPGFAFIAFSIFSLLAGEKGSAPKLSNTRKMLEQAQSYREKIGNKPTLMWPFC